MFPVPLLRLFHTFHLRRKYPSDWSILGQIFRPCQRSGLLSFRHRRLSPISKDSHFYNFPQIEVSRCWAAKYVALHIESATYQMCDLEQATLTLTVLVPLPLTKQIINAYVIGSFWRSNEITYATVNYKADSKHSIYWPNVQLWENTGKMLYSININMIIWFSWLLLNHNYQEWVVRI